MIIIFQPEDDEVVCPYCVGDGVIKLDLLMNKDVIENKRRYIDCGYCEGEGYVDKEYELDADFSLCPPEPDTT